MRYRMLLIVFLLALFTLPTTAQDSETWYWGWKPETGEFFAYTPGGESNTLIESGFSLDQFNAWRIDAQTEYAILLVDDTRQLYRLTPTEAQPTTLSNPDVSLGEAFWTIIARNDQYLALAIGNAIPAGAALLVNIEANTAAPLEWEANIIPQHAGFSADGDYFRYMGRDPENNEHWTIREVKLETGAERVVFTFDEDYMPTATTDTRGDQWIYGQRDENTIIPIQGDPIVQANESPRVQLYNGDGIFSFYPLCEADCEAQWQPSADAPAKEFWLPESETNFPGLIRPISDSQLVVIMDDNFWLLDSNGEARLLGSYDPRYIVNQTNRLLSPDGRYLLAISDSDAPAYHVLDLQTGDTVIEGDVEREYYIVQAFYGGGGFIVSEDGLRFQFFRYSDGQVFELGEPGGIFFEILADDTLLYSQYNREGELGLGIYHYEPDTATFTLLVEDARPLYSN